MGMLRALKTLASRLFSPSITEQERLDLALAAFTRPTDDPLPLLHRLFAEIRRRPEDDQTGPDLRLDYVVRRLENTPELRQAFAGQVLPFLASRRLVSFFADSGILPGTGFFSEWWRIVGHRLLPQVPDARYLKDCTHLVFDRPPGLALAQRPATPSCCNASGDNWRWIRRWPTGKNPPSRPSCSMPCSSWPTGSAAWAWTRN